MKQKSLYLTEVHLQNFSKQERKTLDGWLIPDSWNACSYFRPETPKDVYAWLGERMQGMDLIWCPDHGEWEDRFKPACYKKFYPPDTQSGTGHSSGGEMSNEMREKLEVLESSAEASGEASEGSEESEGEKDNRPDGRGKDDEKSSSRYREEDGSKPDVCRITLKKGPKYMCTRSKGHDGPHIAHVGSSLEDEKYESEVDREEQQQQESDGKGENDSRPYNNKKENPCRTEFNATNGKFLTCTRPTGHKGVHIGHDGAGKEMGRSEGSGKKNGTKKWAKLILNTCPNCLIDTLRKEWQTTPKPSDPMEQLDYTQVPCGCDKLKGIFSSTPPLKSMGKIRPGILRLMEAEAKAKGGTL